MFNFPDEAASGHWVQSGVEGHVRRLDRELAFRRPSPYGSTFRIIEMHTLECHPNAQVLADGGDR